MLASPARHLVRLLNQAPLSQRFVSTLRQVDSTGPRSLALPLCFVSITGYDDSPPSSRWQEWIGKFRNQGYTSLVVELDPTDSINRSKTSRELVSSLEQEFVQVLSSNPSTNSPFPPLLFSSSLSTLVAQSYVSSHPLSGLVLENPVPTSRAVSDYPKFFERTTTTNGPALDEFDFEPFFPVAVVVADSSEGSHEREFRLLRGFKEPGQEEDDFVRKIIGKRDSKGWQEVMDWMDEHGL